jgi:hypothetical protein
VVEDSEGTYFDETKDRCFGILSDGSSPLSSNDVRFKVGRTGCQLSYPRKKRGGQLTQCKHCIMGKVDISDRQLDPSSGSRKLTMDAVVESGHHRGNLNW